MSGRRRRRPERDDRLDGDASNLVQAARLRSGAWRARSPSQLPQQRSRSRHARGKPEFACTQLGHAASSSSATAGGCRPPIEAGSPPTHRASSRPAISRRLHARMPHAPPTGANTVGQAAKNRDCWSRASLTSPHSPHACSRASQTPASRPESLGAADGWLHPPVTGPAPIFEGVRGHAVASDGPPSTSESRAASRAAAPHPDSQASSGVPNSPVVCPRCIENRCAGDCYDRLRAGMIASRFMKA